MPKTEASGAYLLRGKINNKQTNNEQDKFPIVITAMGYMIKHINEYKKLFNLKEIILIVYQVGDIATQKRTTSSYV